MQASTVAIVTGASRGLGEALALGLMQQGSLVLTIARRQNDALAAQAAATGCALKQIQADLADPAAAERVAQDLAAALPPDAQRYILINNAGTVEPIGQASSLINAAAITAAFSLNVSSVMLLTAAFLKTVQPLQADSRILNISSGAGRNPMPGWGVYCATKAALDHYTSVLHAENHGVRVASLAPGVIDTGMQEQIRGSAAADFPNVQRFADMHAQGQLSAPADVAARILRYLDHNDFGTTVLDDIRNHA